MCSISLYCTARIISICVVLGSCITILAIHNSSRSCTFSWNSNDCASECRTSSAICSLYCLIYVHQNGI
jgi:hypothetical protein